MDSILVSITDFRRHAGSYIDKLVLGQSFLIIRDSKPIAQLVPYRQPNGIKSKKVFAAKILTKA